MLRELEEILNIRFREELNIRHLNLVDTENLERFRKDRKTLHLNLAELAESERQEVLELVQSQVEEEGRVLRLNEEEETQSMETGWAEDSSEILEYFHGILSEEYLTVIEKALNLRILIEQQNLTKNQIQEIKGQIARRHGAYAIYLTSLTTAGYFDPNGGLRDLFVDMGLNPKYDKRNFYQMLTEYVEKELICVFIENDDSVYDATQEVRGGLSKYQQEDPIQEWFDIRGIGDGCAEIIDGVMENLEDEFLGIDYDRWAVEDDHWVRIYPRSIPPIT